MPCFPSRGLRANFCAKADGAVQIYGIVGRRAEHVVETGIRERDRALSRPSGNFGIAGQRCVELDEVLLRVFEPPSQLPEVFSGLVARVHQVEVGGVFVLLRLDGEAKVFQESDEPWPGDVVEILGKFICCA
jgi:hypothetical protein